MAILSDNIITCDNGHVQPLTNKICEICGANIKTNKSSIKLNRNIKNLFIGLGETGVNILDKFQVSNVSDVDNSYLFLDTSNKITDVDLENRNQLNSQILFRKLGKLSKGSARNWKKAETEAINDRYLNDYLLESGINQSELVLLLSSLGGGTGCGVGPILFNNISRINLNANKTAFIVLPSEKEAEQLHFNAFCAFSRFLRFQNKNCADLIIVVDNTYLSKYNHVDENGKPLPSNELLSLLLNSLSQPKYSKTTIDFLSILNSCNSNGIIHFVPCVALNHSLRIYENLEAILESATIRPMANIDLESVVASFIILQIPNTMRDRFTQNQVLKEYSVWKDKNLPRELISEIDIRYSDVASDKIDVFAMLGGADVSKILSRSKQGYNVVSRSISSGIDIDNDETPFISRGELTQIEENVVNYGNKLGSIRERVKNN